MDISKLPSIEEIGISIYNEVYINRKNYKRDAKKVCCDILQQFFKDKDCTSLVTEEMVRVIQKYLNKPVGLEETSNIIKDELKKQFLASDTNNGSNDPDWSFRFS
jgi:myo-inositol-1-phosphate synthase